MQKQILVPQKTLVQQEAKPQVIPNRNPFPMRFLLTLCMEAAIIFTGAVLPLRGLEFSAVMAGTWRRGWLFLLTHLLFPGQAIALVSYPPHYTPAALGVAWAETGLFTVSIIILFGFYLLAIRLLSSRVTPRFILFSTGLFGLTYLLYPAITSQDIFSYVAYARIGAIYHLNPLTTLPTAIRCRSDLSLPLLDSSTLGLRPSMGYHHMRSAVACGNVRLQKHFGYSPLIKTVWPSHASRVYLARLVAKWFPTTLLMEVSTQRKIAATLAFAWNPYLLFEASVNAHVDTTILFFVLLAIWCLQMRNVWKPQPYLMAAMLLALAACLKVTLIVLMPGLLLFLWTQQPHRIKSIIGATTVYLCTIVLLYAPFWQHGVVLHVFQINPSTTRDINSPYEFVFRLYASLIGKYIPMSSSYRGTGIEIFTHEISLVLFSIVYGILCLRTIAAPKRINSLPALVKWMALVWLLYCVVGSPWLWPWYFITFFGLFALVEATDNDQHSFCSWLQLSLAGRLLAFAALTLYCFGTWGPAISTVPYIPFFQWIFFRGLWLCLLPLLALRSSSLAGLQKRIKLLVFKDTQHKPG